MIRLITLPAACPGKGQREIEGASLPLSALGPDAPAVGLDDVLGDGQPQPGPPAGAGAVGFVETLEDARQVVGWDAHAGPGVSQGGFLR
jgi:hypothetical protein